MAGAEVFKPGVGEIRLTTGGVPSAINAARNRLVVRVMVLPVSSTVRVYNRYNPSPWYTPPPAAMLTGSVQYEPVAAGVASVVVTHVVGRVASVDWLASVTWVMPTATPATPELPTAHVVPSLPNHRVIGVASNSSKPRSARSPPPSGTGCQSAGGMASTAGDGS